MCLTYFLCIYISQFICLPFDINDIWIYFQILTFSFIGGFCIFKIFMAYSASISSFFRLYCLYGCYFILTAVIISYCNQYWNIAIKIGINAIICTYGDLLTQLKHGKIAHMEVKIIFFLQKVGCHHYRWPGKLKLSERRSVKSDCLSHSLLQLSLL